MLTQPLLHQLHELRLRRFVIPHIGFGRRLHHCCLHSFYLRLLRLNVSDITAVSLCRLRRGGLYFLRRIIG